MEVLLRFRKLFMAYPDVFMLNDGNIFRIMQHATMVRWQWYLCNAENGSVIDVLIEQALKKKNIEPTYHALTRSTFFGSRSNFARINGF